MIEIGEAELIRNYEVVHKKLDKIRDQSIEIKRDIFRLVNEHDISGHQPADDRERIRAELDYVGRHLTYVSYTVNDLYILTSRIIETLDQTPKTCSKLKMMMDHLMTKYDLVCERHNNNLRYAMDTICISSNTFAIA